jgi:transposase
MQDADHPRRFTGLVDWRELWETMMSNSMLKSAKVERKDLDPTVYVAIELSRAKWLVALSCAALSDASRIHQLAGGDVAGLVGLIDGQRQALAARGVRGVRVISCFEAGYDGFWLHRQLLDHDVESHVIDGASLLVDRRAKHLKTDRIDVKRLLRAIIGYASGDSESCRVVHVPSVTQEDMRRISRERERLVRERTGHINRIRALFTAQGVRVARVKDGKWVELLGDLRTGDGRSLPPKLRAELEREWQRLVLVMAQLREVEADRNEIVYSETNAQGVDDDKIRKLAKLRGIGPDFATMLTREVFFRPFRNRRAVAKYFGLTPAPYASGDSRRDQGIDKAGNPRARYVALEAAWMWLRHQPRSELALWFAKRTGNLQGRIRRVMIIALARKLMTALWRYLETDAVPTGAILKA